MVDTISRTRYCRDTRPSQVGPDVADARRRSLYGGRNTPLQVRDLGVRQSTLELEQGEKEHEQRAERERSVLVSG